MESRLDKSARTRKKNLSISSVSSQSGYSDSSVPNSPQNGLDMLDGGDFDLMEMAMDHGPLAGGNVLSASTAPMPSIATDDHLVDFAHSPAPADSPHSYVSPEAVMDPPPSLPKHPPSPAKSVASQYNTPPELSHSSSPPPCNRLFDLEHSTSGCADDSLLAGMARTTAGNGRSLSGTLAIDITETDDDMLIRAFTNDDGLVQLDRDPSLLLMSKFDDDFDSTVSMFTSGDDMFFGGS
jgi:regulatory protein SWI5